MELGDLSSITLHFGFWVENERGEKFGQELEELTYLFDKTHRVFGLVEFVPHHLLYLPNSTFVQNDTVYVCCQIRHGDILPNELPPTVEIQFRYRLWLSYDDGLIDGCAFHVDGKEFKISKTLLGAQSPVFKKMLLSGGEESQSGVIKVADASAELIDAFVEYLHLGTVAKVEHARDLFVLADKYDIQPLRNLCSKHLGRALNDDNIFDRLLFAFQHKDSGLKKRALEYLWDTRNACNFRNLLTSKIWIAFAAKNYDLSVEIGKAIMDNVDSSTE